MDETFNENDEHQSGASEEILDTANRAETYQNLKQRVETLRESEDAGLTAAKELHSIFSTLELLTPREKSNNSHQQKIDEYVLDATIVNIGSELLIKCIDSVDNEVTPYEPTEYANNILNYTEEAGDVLGEQSILKLMNVARKAIRSVPEYNSMYGSLDLNVAFLPKVQKQRQRIVKVVGNKQLLKQVKIVDDVKDSIEHTLVFMYKVLKHEYSKNAENSIKYLRYVIDSESFSNTVKNMFYFSFLIKDGRAGINVENGVAYIWPLKKSAAKKFYEDGGENSQFISSIDMKKWKEYCNAGPGYIQIQQNSNPQ